LPSCRNEDAKDIKIENCIGFTWVPLGLAGLLTIDRGSKRKVYASLAIVEPTLVASRSRGCKAFQATDSIQVTTLSKGLSRAPVFIFRTVNDALQFYYCMPTLKHLFDASSDETSRYTRLIEVTPHIIGRTVYVKFQYTCGDTARQNMVIIATQRACQDFLHSISSKDLGIVDFQIEVNFHLTKSYRGEMSKTLVVSK
jgi:hydroxymethylglutaryl-CoA reductase